MTSTGAHPEALLPTPDAVAKPRTDRTAASFGGALKWSAVMNGGRQATTLLVTFVLARELGPETYGVVALGMIYVAFIQMLLQQGMAAALIHRESLSDEHVDTAFWMVIATSAVLTVASVGLAGWWADLNNTPVLQDVILGLTPLVMLRGLVVVPDGLLRRDMAFKPLAVRTNSSVIIGGVIGVTGALLGWGVWALVAQQVATAVVELVVVWAAVPWRPGVRVSRASARELVGFSVPSAAASLGVFVEARSDALIVGLYFGPAAVGLYRFAARLVDTVTQSIVGTFQAVSLPELARYQHDPEKLGDRLMAIVRLNSGLTILPLAALAAAGPPVMEILGEEWLPAVTALSILTIAGSARTIGNLSGPVLQAVGKPRSLAFLAWIGAVTTTVMLVGAGWLGRDLDEQDQLTLLAATTAFLYSGPYLALNLWVVSRHVTIKRRELARSLGVVIVGGANAYAAGAVVERISVGAPALVRLGLVGGAAMGAGLLFSSALDPALRAPLQRLAGSRRLRGRVAKRTA